MIDFLSSIRYNVNMKEIIYYKTIEGKCPYQKWFFKLDKSIQIRITDRLERVVEGNYGDFKPLGSDISELKFTVGKGYRIYFAEQDNIVVIILSGGDKSDQSNDIKKAKEYFKDYIERNKNE